jgi:hypothetical protein
MVAGNIYPRHRCHGADDDGDDAVGPSDLPHARLVFDRAVCSGSRFGVAFPPTERERFIEEITERSEAFYNMLGKVNTQKSEKKTGSKFSQRCGGWTADLLRWTAAC